VDDGQLAVCYQHFELHWTNTSTKPQHCRITIGVTDSFNQVGTVCWPAGYYLVELCFAYPQLIQGKRVLELGSGVGLTGVCLNKLDPASVVLTDYEEAGPASILSNLRDNIELNCPGSSAVSFSALDWCSCSAQELQQLAAATDLVLAADVVYCPELVTPLVNVLRTLVTCTPDHPVEALVAATLRNPTTLASFVQALVDAPELLVEEVSDVVQAHPLFEYDGRESIHLYRIRSSARASEL